METQRNSPLAQVSETVGISSETAAPGLAPFALVPAASSEVVVVVCVVFSAAFWAVMP